MIFPSTATGESEHKDGDTRQGGVIRAEREKYECFTSWVDKKEYCQYEYAAPNKEVFTTCLPTLEECRIKCMTWIQRRKSRAGRKRRKISGESGGAGKLINRT